MASRDPAELYKDKIEVSLDGRQIFYLFFGGAVIVGLVFVLGVMVGRRVEARGHVDQARTTAAADPLAALDKLEGSNLSFQGALTGGEQRSDVERKIAELEKQRKAKADKHDGKSDGKVDAKPDGKIDWKSDAKVDAKSDGKLDAKSDGKLDAKSDGKVEGKLDLKADGKSATKSDSKSDAKLDAKLDGKPVTKPDGKSEARPDGKSEARLDGKSESKVAAKIDDKPVTRPDGKLEAKSDAKSDGKLEAKADDKKAAEKKKKEGESSESKPRFTLQLSSFQDKHEAEAFLASVKDAGYQPYLTEAEVSGKGTFYRVRLGSYRSMDAANDAKSELERSTKKSATVMRL